MSLAKDFRFAFRTIGQNPWFSAAIVGTIALGIGVNTTVFTLVNAVLFKPLPFAGGERLVMAMANNPSQGRDVVNVSYADFRDFRLAAGSFQQLEGYSGTAVSLSEKGNPPERYRGAYVTAGMFSMLRVQPILGRAFSPADEKAGAVQTMLLGYTVWADRYGKDPHVIGRAVRANQQVAVIVGVMPEGLKYPDNEDLWLAVVPSADWERRNRRAFMMTGILKPGVSIPEAQADLAVVARRLEREYPDTHKDHGVAVRTFHDVMNGGPIRIVFLLMMGAVGFVLLIACANVANMLLSRAIARTREVSIRAALGASRWRILRQLLVESVVLSVTGGIIGLLMTSWGTQAFSLAVADVGKPYWIDFSIDYVVFAYFAVVSVLSGILFGLLPGLQASRLDLHHGLKEGSRSSGGRTGGLLTAGLVVVQFALAVVLLSGAGLMIRSFLVAADEFAHLRGETVLHARINLPEERYGKPEQRQQFFEKLLPRLGSLPGVRAATMVSNPPGFGFAGWRFEIAGKPIAEQQRRPAASVVVAAPNYLRLLGVNLIRGREFEEEEGLPGKEVAIVGQQFVSRFFPRHDPIGQQIRFFRDGNQARPWMTIVGVMPDFRQGDPSNPERDPIVLVPYRFESYGSMALLLRTPGDASALAPALRNEVQLLDGEMPLFEVRSLAESFARSRWHLRVFGTLFLIFALIATGMAAVGIYAVIAHATSRRTREIGVRMALGADTGNILRLVLRRGAVQLVIGTVLGLAMAFAATRLMARLLFGVSPQDPLTFVAVTCTLVAAGLLACWIPARRAAGLDPLRALRHE